MFRTLFVSSLFLLGSWISPATVRGQVSAERVRAAIDNGIATLKRSQSANGSWEEFTGQPGGVTSLCLLALLNAGVDRGDPAIRQGIEFLRRVDQDDKSVYATSLMTMAMTAAYPEQDIAIIRENVRWLETAQRQEAMGRGGWGYYARGDRTDNSNSQFALLALHEAALIGVQVDPAVWQRARDYWVRYQHPSGGWGYTPGDGPSGSMTCAGISSLIIAEENMVREVATVDGRLQCCGQDLNSPELERAIAYWGTRFNARSNPTVDAGDIGRQYFFYYLYGIERAGRLSGRRFFGDHDWYREGAEVLLELEKRVTGGWIGSSSAEQQSEIATSFALLFLAKGRWPVLAAKYRYGAGNDWDRQPQGLHFLVQATEAKWDQSLTWQTVNSEFADTNDLLQSPVIVLSGSTSLRLSSDQKEALVEYVNQGGFVFAWANQSEGCDASGFDRDFRQLMAELFPNSSLDVLSPGHPIWFADQPLEPDPRRPLLGLQACCRTSVVYCPANLACYWQQAHPSRIQQLPDSIRNEVEEVVQLGVNVLAYATSRELDNKLDRPQLAARRLDAERPRTHLELPKLTHTGGADEASSAWQNLLQATSDWLDQPVSQKKQLLAADDPELANFPILFMHGRRDFRFSESEREGLRGFLDEPIQGFLIIDAICGSREFTQAVRREFQGLIPNAEWRQLPADHPIFTQRYRGFDLQRVTLRRPERTSEGIASFRESQISPVLEGLFVDDRLALVFSPYDLSCALENGTSLECEGYSEEDAKKIGINLILFALQN